ncbi:MAG: NAD+ synthase [Bryobacteraceae bacterium]|jgi:NAD+ synthase/NAD+ synthase (glutamine-hydrolysing)
MRIALGQINTTVGDLGGNADVIVRTARAAAEGGARLVVFPELSLTGYPPRDLVEKPSFLERTQQHLARLAAETAHLDIALILGYVGRSEVPAGKRATNSAAVVERGRVVFQQNKALLPTYDVFDETRYFQPAERQSLCAIGGQRVALTICEDAWNDKQFWERRLYRRDPVEELAQAGAEMLISINASPYHIGKRELRREIFANTARRYKIPVIYVNQVGGNDSLIFDGSSFALDAEARVIASGASFREDLVFLNTEAGPGDQHESLPEECEAVYEALALGTRDYIRKCGFQRVLIGLSGGIDSSLTAAIAVDAVGRENVVGVGMPGPYSSEGSLTDARALAANLGIRFEVVKITGIYESYLAALDPLFAGRERDVTEENIQARIRGAILMALSNKWSVLALTTGNKSELAMGYCTLYGDMCGGLAVISDVPKTLVYELARVANRRHADAIPESVFRKPPSAELRPNQTDQDTLPPYDLLDRILSAYVEDYQTPRRIAETLGLEVGFVSEIINKVDGNEYKRQQAAPGLKVTTKAFGIGRRFPIAQRFSE